MSSADGEDSLPPSDSMSPLPSALLSKPLPTPLTTSSMAAAEGCGVPGSMLCPRLRRERTFQSRLAELIGGCAKRQKYTCRIDN